MEYLRRNKGGKGEEQETCFGGRKALILIKNVKEKGAKNPTLLKGKTMWGDVEYDYPQFRNRRAKSPIS